MSHTLINCTCKNRLSFSLLPFTLIPQYLKGSIVLVGLASNISRSFQTVRRMREAWKRGNIYSVSVSFVRVGSQISPHRAKKDSNIPSPGRTRSVKCPTPGPTKTIESSRHALAPPSPLPRRLYIDRCIK